MPLEHSMALSRVGRKLLEHQVANTMRAQNRIGSFQNLTLVLLDIDLQNANTFNREQPIERLGSNSILRAGASSLGLERGQTLVGPESGWFIQSRFTRAAADRHLEASRRRSIAEEHPMEPRVGLEGEDHAAPREHQARRIAYVCAHVDAQIVGPDQPIQKLAEREIVDASRVNRIADLFVPAAFEARPPRKHN